MHLTVGGGRSGSFFPPPRSAGRRDGALTPEEHAYPSVAYQGTAGGAAGSVLWYIRSSRRAGSASRRKARKGGSHRCRKAGMTRELSSSRTCSRGRISSRNALFDGGYVTLRIRSV